MSNLLKRNFTTSSNSPSKRYTHLKVYKVTHVMSSEYVMCLFAFDIHEDRERLQKNECSIRQATAEMFCVFYFLSFENSTFDSIFFEYSP